MRTAVIAIVLALISMPAIAATYNANTIYSAAWHSDEEYYDYHGSFSGKDKNRDGFLTKDELSSFYAYLAHDSRIYEGSIIVVDAYFGDLVDFRYRLYAPSAGQGTMTVLAVVSTCDYFECAGTSDDRAIEPREISLDTALTWRPVAAVPVPASGLLLAPLLGLLAARRKRKA